MNRETRRTKEDALCFLRYMRERMLAGTKRRYIAADDGTSIDGVEVLGKRIDVLEKDLEGP